MTAIPAIPAIPAVTQVPLGSSHTSADGRAVSRSDAEQATPGHVPPGGSTESAVKSIQAALTSDDVGLIVVGLRLLMAMGPSAELLVPTVSALLRSPDSRIQRAAIESISVCAGRGNAEALKSLLSHKVAEDNVDVLLQAYIAIGPAAKAAIPFASDAAHHPRGQVRALALRALMALGAPEDRLLVVARVARTDRHASVRAVARRISAFVVEC